MKFFRMQKISVQKYNPPNSKQFDVLCIDIYLKMNLLTEALQLLDRGYTYIIKLSFCVKVNVSVGVDVKLEKQFHEFAQR